MISCNYLNRVKHLLCKQIYDKRLEDILVVLDKKQSLCEHYANDLRFLVRDVQLGVDLLEKLDDALVSDHLRLSCEIKCRNQIAPVFLKELTHRKVIAELSLIILFTFVINFIFEDLILHLRAHSLATEAADMLLLCLLLVFIKAGESREESRNCEISEANGVVVLDP